MSAYWVQFPNALSISRIPLAVAFLLLYDVRQPVLYLSALAAALLAIVTDFADGRLARRWGVASQTGYFLDGLGDKAFYIAVLIVMLREHASNDLLIWLLIMREVLLYALRSLDPEREEHMARLRSLSLWYAFLIRMYFLYFVVLGALQLERVQSPPVVRWAELFGYAAMLTGYYSIAKLVRAVARKI